MKFACGMHIGGETGLADVVTFEFREGDGALWVSHFRQNRPVGELRLLGDLSGRFWECQDPVSGNLDEWVQLLLQLRGPPMARALKGRPRRRTGPRQAARQYQT